jgi:hypothetical protein
MGTRAHRVSQPLCLLGVILLGCLVQGLFQEAGATTIYSYVDERGTAVMTDNYNNIPERYRSKVQITETSPSSHSTGSPMATLHNSVTHVTKDIAQGMKGLAPDIPGMSSYQSQILTYAGLIALVCLAAMYLSRGQVTRFLALWCLILVGLATPVLLYVSKDGPLDILRGKAGEIQEKQQDRLKQAP